MLLVGSWRKDWTLGETMIYQDGLAFSFVL
jgi:hypothetical protein